MPAVLLLIAITAAPLMVGSVHPSTATVLAVLISLALWSHQLTRERSTLSIPLLGWWLLALLGWMALSLVPLPGAVLGFVSPQAGELWAFAPLAEVTRPSLSCSPGGTSLEIVELCAVVCAFLLSCELTQYHRERTLMYWGVVGTAVLVAIISALQSVAGTETILGLYRPVSGSLATFRTPFVNPNHAAMYFELAGFAAVGGAVAWTGRARGAAVACGLILLGSALATGSGGARIIVVAGLAFVGALVLARRGRRWVAWAVPALAVAGLVVAITAGNLQKRDAPHELLDSLGLTTSKLDYMPGALQMIGDHALAGVGRGGFGAVYPAYQPVGRFVRYTHSESGVLQLVAELGLPLATVTVVLIGLLWAIALLRWRGDPSVAGALAAVFAVSLHSIFEFGLEFGGLAIPFAATAGLLASAVMSGQLAPVRLSRRGSLALSAALATCLLAAPVALLHGSWTAERRNLQMAEQAGTLGEMIGPALRWHPCSPDVSFAIGSALAESSEPGHALQFLNRCMVLDPRNPLPHLLASDVLAGMGQAGQAALEANLALDLDPHLQPRVFRSMARLLTTSEEVLRYLGTDPDRVAAYAQFLLETYPGRAEARKLGLQVAEAAPDSPAAARLLAGVEWADGRRDVALQRLATASEAHPGDVALAKYHAALLRAAGEGEAALDVLDAADRLAGPHVELLYQRALTEIELEQHPGAHATVRQMRRVVAPTQFNGLALVAAVEGRLAVAEGNPRRARAHYLESLRLRPDRVGVRLELGRTYQELGEDDEALKQYRRIRRETDAYPFLDDWIEELAEAQGGGGTR